MVAKFQPLKTKSLQSHVMIVVGGISTAATQAVARSAWTLSPDARAVMLRTPQAYTAITAIRACSSIQTLVRVITVIIMCPTVTVVKKVNQAKLALQPACNAPGASKVSTLTTLNAAAAVTSSLVACIVTRVLIQSTSLPAPLASGRASTSPS